MPVLVGITIFPVKSLDGLAVFEAEVVAGGALANDRRWRLVDAEGRVVHAKRTPRLHLIRAEFSLAGGRAEACAVSAAAHPAAAALPAGCGENLVTLWQEDLQSSGDAAASGGQQGPGRRETFELVPGREGPCGWLSDALGMAVFLEERADGGFPDDRDAPGPTLISTETLVEVARWFGWPVEEARRRLRMNLEADGSDLADEGPASGDRAEAAAAGGAGSAGWSGLAGGPFWEDALASPAWPLPAAGLVADLAIDPYADLPPAEPHGFAIGGVAFRATGVCRRCVVPGRDSRTGRETAAFREAFEARRSRGLRPDVDARRWGGYYRLGVNTTAGARNGGCLVPGMPLVMTGPA